MANRIQSSALVIHGGGPTPVLNASLAGLVAEARRRESVVRLLGADHGMDGALSGSFFDLLKQPASVIDALPHAPGSAIGSSRRHMREEDYGRLQEVLAREGIRYVIVTGGNGTQEAGLRILQSATAANYELAVVGIPKTVDNDLGYTHFSPGYPSAARFLAQAVRDIGEDNRSLPSPIQVTEVIGRNAGWVVGATALARQHDDDPPHLVYLPEHPVSEDQLCSDVEGVYRRLGRCVVAVCEGQRNTEGEPFGAESNAAPGSRDRLASNLGHQLAALLTQRLGVRARSEKPGLLGRSSCLDVPAIDRDASFGCGVAALRDLMAGESGHMVTIEPIEEAGADLRFGRVPLATVAMEERLIPQDWIAPAGNDVTQDFLNYVRPLVGPIKAHPRLTR